MKLRFIVFFAGMADEICTKSGKYCTENRVFCTKNKKTSGCFQKSVRKNDGFLRFLYGQIF